MGAKYIVALRGRAAHHDSLATAEPEKTIDDPAVRNNRAAPSQGAGLLSHAYLNVSLVGVLLGVCGCQSMSVVKERVEPGEGTVEVRFAPPRTVEVRNPDGSRTSLEAVTKLRGQPITVRGDSVTIRLNSWEGGNPFSDHPESGETVLSASDPGVGFFKDRFSVKKNLLVVAIVVGLLSLAIGQASVGY